MNDSGYMKEGALAGGWNYRLINHNYGAAPETIGIHEVYYDAQGRPNGYIMNKSVMGDTPEELREIFKMMALAFSRPMLRLEILDGELVEIPS